MLLRILSIIFPVFAIAGIGYLYGRYKRPNMALANQLNMDLFVPMLVFSALSSKSFDVGNYAGLAIAGVAVILGSGVLAWPFVRLLKVEYRTFLPGMMFNNSGNMGLPLALLAFGEAAMPAAIVLFAIEMLLHFSLGIWILNRQISLAGILRVPVIIATIAGLGFSAADITLWQPLEIMIRMLADVSIPLLLFSLGVRLTEVSFKDWQLGVASAILCPATGLAIVFMIMPFLNLPPMQQSLLVVFGALPPAVLNYLMAEQYRQEPQKVASIVLLGNLGSLVVMPLALAYALN
jgi:predicted permease